MKRRDFLALEAAVMTLTTHPAAGNADPAVIPPSGTPAKPSAALDAEGKDGLRIKIVAIDLAAVDGIVEANDARALRMADRREDNGECIVTEEYEMEVLAVVPDSPRKHG